VWFPRLVKISLFSLPFFFPPFPPPPLYEYDDFLHDSPINQNRPALPLLFARLPFASNAALPPFFFLSSLKNSRKKTPLPFFPPPRKEWKIVAMEKSSFLPPSSSNAHYEKRSNQLPPFPLLLQVRSGTNHPTFSFLPPPPPFP